MAPEGQESITIMARKCVASGMHGEWKWKVRAEGSYLEYQTGSRVY